MTKKILRYSFRIVAVVFLLLVLLSAGLLLWLQNSERSIALVGPYIRTALSEAEFIDSVRFADVRFSWIHWLKEAEVRIDSLEVYGTGGAVLARSNDVVLALSLLNLLEGRVEVLSARFNAPEINLAPFLDGSIRLGDDSAPADSSTLSESIIRSLANIPAFADAHPSLERIEFVDARLDARVLDPGLAVAIPSLVLERNREEHSARLAMQADYRLAGASTPLDIRIDYPGPRQAMQVALGFRGFRPAGLARLDSSLHRLQRYPLVLDGVMSARCRAEGRIDSLGLRFDSIRGLVADTALLPADFRIQRGFARLALLKNTELLRLDTLYLHSAGPEFSATGKFYKPAGPLDADLRLTLRNLAVADAGRYWPVPLEQSARMWVGRHLRAGQVRYASAAIRTQPPDSGSSGRRDSVLAHLWFQDLHADYHQPFPPLVSASGHARLSTKAITVELHSGRLAHSQVDSGQVHFTKLGTPENHLAITAGISGPAADISDFIILASDSEQARQWRADSGRAVTQVAMAFVPGPDAAFRTMEFRAQTAVRNLAVGDFLGLAVSNSECTARLHNGALEVDGDFYANGVAARIGWRENIFARPAGRLVSIKAKLSPQDCADLGAGNLDFLAGRAAVEAVLSMGAEGTHIDGVMDLRDIAFAIDVAGLRKQRGVAGQLRFTAELPDDKLIKVRRFQLESPALRARGHGSIRTGAQPAFRFVLPEVRYGANHLDLIAERNAAGSYKLVFAGGRFDAEPLLAALYKEKTAHSATHAPVLIPPALAALWRQHRPAEEFSGSISGTLDTVLMRNGHRLHTARFQTEWDSTRMSAGRIVGSFPDGAGATFSLQPQGGKKHLFIASDNAGDFLLALDLYKSVRGGRLALNATVDDFLPPVAIVPARMRLDEFSLVDVSAIMKLVSYFSVFAPLEQLQSGEGIFFNSMTADLEYNKGLLTVLDSRMGGANLSITARGTLNPGTATMNMRGTVGVLNFMNDLLRWLPLVGETVVGDGVLSANFTAWGNIERPETSVDLTSLLLLGGLRDVFD